MTSKQTPLFPAEEQHADPACEREPMVHVQRPWLIRRIRKSRSQSCRVEFVNGNRKNAMIIDDNGIVVRLRHPDGTIASVPIRDIFDVRPKASWAESDRIAQIGGECPRSSFTQPHLRWWSIPAGLTRAEA